MSTPASKPPPSVGKRVAVSAIAGVTIAWGGLTAVSWISSSTSTDELSLPVHGDTINIDVGSGDVQVRTGDVDEVQVTRSIHSGLTMPELTSTSDASGITLAAECGWNWMGPCSVDYELVVPADLDLNVDSNSGEVDIADVTGDVTVDASSGDIEASGLSGQVALSTTSGDIAAENISGPLTTNASSGDISASGLTGETVDAEASSGDIQLTFAAAPGDVEASASSGDVTLLLPDDGTAYRVETEVSSGDEAIDVPIQPDAANVLSVETSSGDISIRHNGA